MLFPGGTYGMVLPDLCVLCPHVHNSAAPILHHILFRRLVLGFCCYCLQSPIYTVVFLYLIVIRPHVPGWAPSLPSTQGKTWREEFFNNTVEAGNKKMCGLVILKCMLMLSSGNFDS